MQQINQPIFYCIHLLSKNKKSQMLSWDYNDALLTAISVAVYFQKEGNTAS